MSRSKAISTKDFGADGIDIQTAMIRHAQAHPERSKRPKNIIWAGEALWTSFDVVAPEEGRFRIEFLSEAREPYQGVDVKAEDGAITLPSGEDVKILRTWHDPRYEGVVEYPYSSKAGTLKVWNVYHRSWPDGRTTEEKWTGNAGFRVEQEAEGRWIFRCSNGPSRSPDFDQLVFRLVIEC